MADQLVARVRVAVEGLANAQREVVTLRETNQRVLLHRGQSKVRLSVEEYVVSDRTWVCSPELVRVTASTDADLVDRDALDREALNVVCGVMAFRWRLAGPPVDSPRGKHRRAETATPESPSRWTRAHA